MADIEGISYYPAPAHEDRAINQPEVPNVEHPNSVEDAAPLVAPASNAADEENDYSFDSHRTNPMFVGLGKWTQVAHLVCILLVAFLFIIAICCAEWRIIKVDRETLIQEIMKMEDEELLNRAKNETMFFSRRVGIYEECLIGNTSFLHSRCSGLDFLPRKGFHNPKYYKIIRLIQTTMILAPVIVSMAVTSVIIHSRIFMVKDQPKLSVVSALVHLMILNTKASIAFLITAGFLDVAFGASDPGYPESWPEVLRENSKVYPHQASMFLFAIAVVTQFLTLVIDVIIARRFVRLSRHSTSRRWFTWFLK